MTVTSLNDVSSVEMRKGHVFILYVLSFLCWQRLGAQSLVSGVVRDMGDKKAIAFCAVGLLHSSRGCLSNEEGVFVISLRDEDTLLIYSIGYRKKLVTANELKKNRIVELQSSEKLLDEVTVLANDERAYQLLARSRKALMGSQTRQAKSYFMLSSEIEGQPVELLECYYTAKLNDNRVQGLEFKNGRVGLAPYLNRYFVSLDISGAFTLLNLLYEDKRMPENPYQLNLKSLKRRYVARLEEGYDSLSPVQVLRFTAKDSLHGFSGKVHILKANALPLKIELYIRNTSHHPFRPLFPNAQILNADMRLNKVFDYKNDSLYTHHIDFDYQLNYRIESESRQVQSKGLMYFYDYHKPFYPILYPFNPELNDYKKISSLSYNEDFWKDNQVLEYSGSMLAQRDFLEKQGLTLNYSNVIKVQTAEQDVNFFENNDITWKAEKRLSVIESKMLNDTSGAGSGSEGLYRVNQYQFKANIYLDANAIGDSLQHYSVTVLDVQQSFYNLKTDLYTDCFLNMYFDLVEIERRKMEEEIAKYPNSWANIQACYSKALAELENTTLRYFKDVERGTNKKRLEEWNQKIVNELGINNIEIFNILYK